MTTAVKQLEALSTTDRAPLIVIDDAEALDSTSRNTIRRIMLSPEAPSALWVLARRGDVGSMSDDDKLLQAAGHAEVVALEGLDGEGTESLVAARLGDVPPEGLAAALRERTGGHPGLTVEALRGAAEIGALNEGDVGFVLDLDQLRDVRLPESFEQSRLKKLASLDRPARDLAQFLAVVGRAVKVDDIPGEAVDDPEVAVSALAESGLGARTETMIALQPPALAGAIIEDADRGRVEELHRAAARLRGATARERFEHLRALEDVSGALAAADEAFPETRDPELAVATAEMLRGSDDIGAAQWYDRAADVLLERGKLAEAAPLLDAALELDSETDAKWDRWIKGADAWARVGDAEKGKALAEAGLGAGAEGATRSRLLAASSTSLRFAGELALAKETARGAEEAARRLGDSNALAYALLARTGTEILDQQFRSASETAREAAGLFASTGVHALEIAARSNIAIALRSLGEYQEASEITAGCLRLSIDSGNRHLMLRQQMLSGTLNIDAGNWSPARSTFSEGLRLALEDGVQRDTALCMANLAQLDGLTGRPRQAGRRAKLARRLAHNYEPPAIAYAYRSLAQAFRTSGHYRRAEKTSLRSLALDHAGQYPRISRLVPLGVGPDPGCSGQAQRGTPLA